MRTPAVLAELADLVLGHACIGCSAIDGVLCANCLGELSKASTPADLAVPGEPSIYAAQEYSGLAKAVVIAHKEHGMRALAEPIGVSLAEAVARAMLARHLPTQVALVPIPARRQRSFDHVAALARVACRTLSDCGVDAVVAPALESRGHSALKSLGRAERARAVRGAFAMRPHRLPSLVRSRSVIVVDDVVTTGATTHEATRVLANHGIFVLAVACFARTLRKEGEFGRSAGIHR